VLFVLTSLFSIVSSDSIFAFFRLPRNEIDGIRKAKPGVFPEDFRIEVIFKAVEQPSV
jgi:hypothetical protein